MTAVCDVIEAGLQIPNGDGLLGSIVPPTIDPKEVLTSRTTGYTVPNTNNYITYAPIVITTQPTISPTNYKMQQLQL
jgi:hypothetical protein